MRKQNAFSLPELLVAVVLLGVLVAIGAGGLQRMQAMSIVTSDLRNLQQIGVGAHLYIRDHNGIIPPVIGRVDGQIYYSHELIGQKLGYLEDMRSTTFRRSTWGPFISKADKGEPPAVSPLRSYGVNMYVGDVVTLAYTEVKLAKRLVEVTYPAQTLYFAPMKRDSVDPNAQSRFSDITISNTSAGSFRADRDGRTVALWVDGHVSAWQVPATNAELAAVALPKRQ